MLSDQCVSWRQPLSWSIYNRLHCVVPQIMSECHIGVDGLLIVWVLCVCFRPEVFLVSCLEILLHTTRRSWRCHVLLFSSGTPTCTFQIFFLWRKVKGERWKVACHKGIHDSIGQRRRRNVCCYSEQQQTVGLVMTIPERQEPCRAWLADWMMFWKWWYRVFAMESFAILLSVLCVVCIVCCVLVWAAFEFSIESNCLGAILNTMNCIEVKYGAHSCGIGL